MKPGLLGLLIAGGLLAPPLAMPAAARDGAVASAPPTSELSAQTIRRPRIMIYPRRTAPGPDATRICRSQLVIEYRASGTVIVPHTRCWWQ